MEEIRPFKEKSPKPEPELLKKALGNCFPLYEALLEKTGTFSAEWNHSKTSGWMLKIADRKKALCYLIPLQDAFRVHLTVREAEKEILLKEKSLSGLHEQLRGAKKYTEGFLVQFLVSDRPSAKKLMDFLKKLLETRV